MSSVHDLSKSRRGTPSITTLHEDETFSPLLTTVTIHDIPKLMVEMVMYDSLSWTGLNIIFNLAALVR